MGTYLKHSVYTKVLMVPGHITAMAVETGNGFPSVASGVLRLLILSDGAFDVLQTRMSYHHDYRISYESEKIQ